MKRIGVFLGNLLMIKRLKVFYQC